MRPETRKTGPNTTTCAASSRWCGKAWPMAGGPTAATSGGAWRPARARSPATSTFLRDEERAPIACEPARPAAAHHFLPRNHFCLGMAVFLKKFLAKALNRVFDSNIGISLQKISVP
jgi:hypothetical protein